MFIIAARRVRERLMPAPDLRAAERSGKLDADHPFSSLFGFGKLWPERSENAPRGAIPRRSVRGKKRVANPGATARLLGISIERPASERLNVGGNKMGGHGVRATHSYSK